MFCPVCGSKLPDGASFCANCGNRVTGNVPAGHVAAGQQPYQAQSQYQSGPQYQAPQPPNGGKSNTALIVGIVVAVVAVVAIVVVLVVVNPFGSGGAESSSSSSASASSLSSSSSATESGSSESKSKSSSSSSSKSSKSSSSEKRDFNTTDKPTLADFGWISSPHPSGATLLSSIDEVTGDWKGYLSGDGSAELMMNVHIEKKNGAVFVTVKWYDPEGHSREDSSFSGDWTGGTMDVVGSGRITIDSWWQKSGHQYAVGEFIWPSGERPAIYLVRP